METTKNLENMKLFESYLLEKENAPATIRKYKTDVHTFSILSVSEWNVGNSAE